MGGARRCVPYMRCMSQSESLLSPSVSRDLGLLLLRLSAGGTMALAHGLSKMNRFAELSERFPDPLGVGSWASAALAIFAELGCGVAVALGLFTRAALLPLMVTMGVAAFVIHGDDPFRKQELALIYLAMYTTLLATGPGRFSLDALIRGRVGRTGR